MHVLGLAINSTPCKPLLVKNRTSLLEIIEVAKQARADPNWIEVDYIFEVDGAATYYDNPNELVSDPKEEIDHSLKQLSQLNDRKETVARLRRVRSLIDGLPKVRPGKDPDVKLA